MALSLFLWLTIILIWIALPYFGYLLWNTLRVVTNIKTDQMALNKDSYERSTLLKRDYIEIYKMLERLEDTTDHFKKDLELLPKQKPPATPRKKK